MILVPAGPGGLKALAQHWLSQGRPAMVVQVLATRGSVPREAGTRMLVAEDVCAGTIGGGQLEWQAIHAARSALAAGLDAPPEHQVALGPSLGQCCGGMVRLGMTRLDQPALDAWPEMTPLFRLQLHGAGHVGQALVRLLATLPCELHWVDQRDEPVSALALAGPLPAHVRLETSDAPIAEVATAPPGTWYLVMTHSHALDLQLVQAILARADAGWLGLIGSATKRARFEHRLAERGHSPAALASIHCPVGLPDIVGKAPELVAMSIAAQLVQRASSCRTTS